MATTKEQQQIAELTQRLKALLAKADPAADSATEPDGDEGPGVVNCPHCGEPVNIAASKPKAAKKANAKKG